jgi:hypothetical protein
MNTMTLMRVSALLFEVILISESVQIAFAEAPQEQTQSSSYPSNQMPTKVTFDSENTMYVDGRPLIPVFLWHGGTAQANVTGENLSRDDLTDDPQYWRRMKQVPHSFIRVVAQDQDWKNQLEKYVPFVKQQPSALAYFLTHEPSFGTEPPALINEIARKLHKLDPDHPTFVHIGGDNPMRARMYSEDSEILSISSMGIDPGLMAIKMARAQRITNGEKAIWPCMHPFVTNYDQWTTDHTAITDTRTVRCCVYMAFINGAKGISLYAPDHYYEWLTVLRHKKPSKMDHVIIDAYESMDEILAEIRYMTPIIAAPTCQQLFKVTGDNGRLTTLVKSIGGELFLLSANHTPESFDATFDVSDLTNNREFEVRAPLEGKELWFGRQVKSRSSEAAFSDHYEPYGVHLYRITSRVDNRNLEPGDADFDPPLESKEERLSRYQATIDRTMPWAIFSPLGDRDPMFWDQQGDTRFFALDPKLYAKQMALQQCKEPDEKLSVKVKTQSQPQLNTYSDVTRYYFNPAEGKSVHIEVNDVRNDLSSPAAILLLSPDGVQLQKAYTRPGENVFQMELGVEDRVPGTYSLIVKSLAHQVRIDGCPSAIDASEVLTYVGDGTTFYFNVPAGLESFSVTSMTSKGKLKGVGEGNMIEVIDPDGKVVDKKMSHYLEKMVPLEEGGGERADWHPMLRDPGPAKVTVHRNPAEARKSAVYSVRLGPPSKESGMSFVPVFYLRLDPPLSGLVSETPSDVLCPK